MSKNLKKINNYIINEPLQISKIWRYSKYIIQDRIARCKMD